MSAEGSKEERARNTSLLYRLYTGLMVLVCLTAGLMIVLAFERLFP